MNYFEIFYASRINALSEMVAQPLTPETAEHIALRCAVLKTQIRVDPTLTDDDSASAQQHLTNLQRQVAPIAA